MQLGFSRLWDGFTSDKEAMQARNIRAKEIKKLGKRVKCFTIPNQTKPYDGLGQVNGGVCNVYMLDYQDNIRYIKISLENI